jgi:hypothetical protein
MSVPYTASKPGFQATMPQDASFGFDASEPLDRTGDFPLTRLGLSPGFRLTGPFTISEPFNISDGVTFSTRIRESAGIPKSFGLAATGKFGATAAFLATASFLATDSLIPAEVSSLASGESWSVSLILDTYTQTLSARAIATETVTNFVTRGDSYTMIDASASIMRNVTFQTEAATRLTAIVYQPVIIPVFRTTAVRIEINMEQPKTPPAEGDNNALIIGVATGAGLLVALLAGGFVFLVRSGHKSSRGTSSLEDHPRDHYDDIVNISKDVDEPQQVSSEEEPERGQFDTQFDLAGAAGDLDLDGPQAESMTAEVWI